MTQRIKHATLQHWYQHRGTVQKTFSYLLMHMVVAILVAYGITRDWHTAIALSLIEPCVQAVAFFFHEKAWARWLRRRAPAPSLAPSPAATGAAIMPA